MNRFRLLLAVVLLALPGVLQAQQNDILTGRVLGPDSLPLTGAQVVITSLETGTSKELVTDGRGRWTVIFSDGGGRYIGRISYLGMADRIVPIVRQSDEEVLIANVALQEQAIALREIQVRARMAPDSAGDVGQQSIELTQDLLNLLALPDFDPVTLALLTAGVTGTVMDSVENRMGFSVGGMRDALNQVTLDGASFGSVMDGSGAVAPQEGVRRTQVVTNSYDVSRGQFAGGQVAMQSARGGNRRQGSLSYSLRDSRLQAGGVARFGELGAAQHRM
jgi:hypothetical protein